MTNEKKTNQRHFIYMSPGNRPYEGLHENKNLASKSLIARF
jgi:hypothetical protein